MQAPDLLFLGVKPLRFAAIRGDIKRVFNKAAMPRPQPVAQIDSGR
jgi:hypothetical protein